MMLMLIAPTDILNELAIRSFTGSRDLPKDHIRANELFRQSEINAVTEQDHSSVLYYNLLLKKYKIHQESIIKGN